MVYTPFDILSWCLFGLRSRFVVALSPLTAHFGLMVHGLRPKSVQKNQPKKIEHKPESDVAQRDYIEDIRRESATEWQGLIDHPFPRDLAKGTAPLNGFRYHSIQDATHFEYFYRGRMEAIARTGTLQEIKEFAKILSGGLDAVTKARDECTAQLGVSKDVVLNEPDSEPLQNFIDLVSAIANKGDYLDLIITLLPGILAYDHIANELLKDPDTVRNTLYFNLFVELYSGNPIKKYITYVNSHIASLSQEERDRRWKGWIDNFKKGCTYEKDFFGLGSSGNFPAYEIVPDGIYKIRSYRRGNPYLVCNGPSTLTTQEGDPQDEGVWKLTNSPDGYIIENVARKRCLCAFVKDPNEPVHEVYLSHEEQRWSINPVKVKGPKGPYKAYQLLVSTRMQFVLDAGRSEGDRKVVVENNAKSTAQLWVLDRVQARDVEKER